MYCLTHVRSHLKHTKICTFQLLVFAVALTTQLFAQVSSPLWKGEQTGHDSADTIKFQYQEECGNPIRESMLWATLDGRVLSVLNDSTLEFATGDSEIRLVRLAMIHPPDQSEETLAECRLFLGSEVLGKSVTILLDPNDHDSLQFEARVIIANREINQVMLEAGIASYRPPRDNRFSWYIPCVYRVLERRARENHLGIWSARR